MAYTIRNPYRGQSPEQMRRSFSVLEGYWNSVRSGSNSGPAAGAFDASAIEQVLPYSFVIEQLAAGLSRLRVCGTEMEKIFGQDMRGMPINAMFGPQSRTVLQGLLDQAYSGPMIIETRIRYGDNNGRLLILPMATTYGEVMRAMCAVILDHLTTLPGSERLQLVGEAYRMQPLATHHKLFSVISGGKDAEQPTHAHRSAPNLSLVVNNLSAP